MIGQERTEDRKQAGRSDVSHQVQVDVEQTTSILSLLNRR